MAIMDEIKSSGKISILIQFNIAGGRGMASGENKILELGKFGFKIRGGGRGSGLS